MVYQDLIHWVCMLLSWGLLLPSGTLIARFFKHRPNGLWYKIHRVIQVEGLTVALVGWIVAICYYGPGVFANVGQDNFYHAIGGTIVMVLGLLQPLNAFVSPTAPKPREDKTRTRFVWEVIHKCTGWLAVLLAIPTIGLGLTLPSPRQLPTNLIGYVGCIIPLLLLLITYMFFNKHNYRKEQATKNTDEAIMTA